MKKIGLLIIVFVLFSCTDKSSNSNELSYIPDRFHGLFVEAHILNLGDDMGGEIIHMYRFVEVFRDEVYVSSLERPSRRIDMNRVDISSTTQSMLEELQSRYDFRMQIFYARRFTLSPDNHNLLVSPLFESLDQGPRSFTLFRSGSSVFLTFDNTPSSNIARFWYYRN
ncbi:MAG: hypothetical protein FWE37_05800 [Spirochaetaceae bacterium]|nr:hypothetical protein [Spirochaetaceae bacterium]